MPACRELWPGRELTFNADKASASPPHFSAIHLNPRAPVRPRQSLAACFPLLLIHLRPDRIIALSKKKARNLLPRKVAILAHRVRMVGLPRNGRNGTTVEVGASGTPMTRQTKLNSKLVMRRSDEILGFPDKVRTFALTHAKQLSRGYYPMSMIKGKNPRGKGKSKSKSFGKKGSPSPKGTPSSINFGKGAPTGQKPGSPEYKGCFARGSKDHDFRSCPKRTSDRPTSTAHFIGSIFSCSDEDTVDALANLTGSFPGCAVIDSGATDSIASLEALQQIMNARILKFGEEPVTVHPQQKAFRFGMAKFRKLNLWSSCHSRSTASS